MSTVNSNYGTSNQAISITLNGLASSATAGRSGTVVDNSTNLFLDSLVSVTVVTSASALANDKACYVYAYGTTDGGTTYTDGVAGTDATFTHTDPPNLRLIGVINCPAISTTYKSGPFSVAAAFGGVLPQKWGIVVRNFTGQALGTGCSANYQGVTSTVA